MPTTSLTRTKWVSVCLNSVCADISVFSVICFLTHTHTDKRNPSSISILHHDVDCALVTHNYTMLPSVSNKPNTMAARRREGGKNPPPHIIFPLIAHFLLRSPPHIPNTPLEEKQAVTPSRVLTNLALLCHPSLPLIFSQDWPAAGVCLPAGLNLLQKNQRPARKLMLEDRRIQTNTVIRT